MYKTIGMELLYEIWISPEIRSGSILKVVIFERVLKSKSKI